MSGKRIHGSEEAGGGHVGAVSAGPVIGPCPSCGAELYVSAALNPHSGQFERCLLHPIPFCTYFGETIPDEIERAIVGKP